VGGLSVLFRLYLKHLIRAWQDGRRNPFTLLALAWLRFRADLADRRR
jgi:hypothetical protein